MTSRTQWISPAPGQPAPASVGGRLPVALLLAATGLSLVAYVLLPPDYRGLAVLAPVALAVGILGALKPELALLGVVLFAPFDNTRFFDAYLPPDLSASKILGFLLIGSLVFSIVVLRRRFRFMDDPQDLLVLLFLASIVFSAVASDHTRTVLGEVDRIVRLVALYFAVKNLATSPRIIFLILATFFLATVYTALFGIHEVATGLELRASGIDDNPNRFAMTSVIAACIGFYLFLSSRRFLLQLLFFAGTAIIVFGILLAASRGGLLSLSVVVVIFILRQPKRLQIGVALAIILAFALPVMPEALRNRVFAPSEGFLNEEEESAVNSVDRRFDYYLVGMQIVSSHPVIGAGYRSFRQIFPYSDLAFRNNELTVSESSRVAHNVYLETLTGTGVLGLTAFLGMLYVAWRSFRRARSLSPPGSTVWAAASGLEYALIGYMVSSMFISSDQDKYVWILLGMSSALLFYARTHAAASTSPIQPVMPGQPAAEPLWLADQTPGGERAR